METFFQDVRYGLRMLRKNPAFTCVAALTLALGIGANTAIFTLINAVLLTTLPVKDPGGLVAIGNPENVHARSQGGPSVEYFSAPLYRDLNQASGQIFSGMLASGEVHRIAVRGHTGEITDDATGVLASGNYFSVLGVNALVGRVFTDDGAKGSNPVVVLSYGFWKSNFGADRDVIGQELQLNRHNYTIIGVTPPGFVGDTVGDSQDFWVPLSMQEELLAGRSWLQDYSASWLHLLARLRPGVSINRAKAALNVSLQQLVNGAVGAAFNPSDREDLKKSVIEVSAGGRGFSELRGEFFKALMLLSAIVALVLLIACVNVANLLLVRAAARTREFAVRIAIGASPGRLMRQLLTESLVLAFAGGLLGLLLAHWATVALIKLSGNDQLQASPDLRVLAFTATACLLTGIFFGLIPAWRSRRTRIAPALKADQSGETASRSFWTWGRILVAFQVALSLSILFGASLLIASLRNMRKIDLGYNHEHVLLLRADPVAAGYDAAQSTAFANQMIEKFASLPGVRSASYSKNGLFSGSESDESIDVEGFTPKNEHDRACAADYIGPGYFAAVGIPILLGRDIGPQDTPASTKVAVINQSMAKFYFGSSNPIGRRFKIDDPQLKTPFVIVGVSKDARDHELKGKIERRFYVPLAQSAPRVSVNFEIRTAGDPASVAESARQSIKEFDRNMPIYSTRSLDELLDRSISNEILIARLAGFFGLLGLGLACVGLYGIMSYTVSGRTREIGVRMALGAQRRSVLWIVVREVLSLLAVGVLVGIPVSIAAGQMMSSKLFGLKPTDPASMTIVVGLLGAVALLAGLIPARRATRVDPMVALRNE